MEQRFSFVADDRLARRVNRLAHEYDLSTGEVLHQLVAVGLEEVEGDRSGTHRPNVSGTRMGDD